MVDGKSLNDWQDEVGTWADSIFPASVESVMAHLRRECTELLDEPDPIKRQVECADVLMLMLHLAHKEGWWLQGALKKKFDINKQRRWGKPDAEGVVEHIRAATPAPSGQDGGA